MVKESMDEYLAQILSPEKLLELKKEHDEFEVQRRGKRSSNDKPEPKKVFDIIDQFTSDYQKYYEEPSAIRNRNNRN
uniref:Type I site-specific deoxyribonuclease n=1 Tax=Caenorhabditis tropicalis TaxID=1561998 RepID=A0A1I7U6D3_9PELO